MRIQKFLWVILSFRPFWVFWVEPRLNFWVELKIWTSLIRKPSSSSHDLESSYRNIRILSTELVRILFCIWMLYTSCKDRIDYPLQYSIIYWYILVDQNDANFNGWVLSNFLTVSLSLTERSPLRGLKLASFWSTQIQ